MKPEDLHRDCLVIDSHNDTIVNHICRGNHSVVRGGANAEEPSGTIARQYAHSFPVPLTGPVQINLSKMRQGGIDTGFFAVDVTAAFKNHLNFALDGIGYLLYDIARHGAEVSICRNSADILEARRTGKPGIILAIEHADCVEGSLNVLRSLFELGVRSIGLTHNVSSQAADGCMEAREGVGLSVFGIKLVREMNRLGMLVDLAHVSPGAFYSALEVSGKPVIFSHGNARALCDHPRNLDDAQLEALALKGGVIGMSFVPYFVNNGNPTLDRLLDHIDHVRSVAGVETVGLGSDFDGGGTLLADATHYPRITEGLVGRGYSEEEIRKILGGNTLRVLRETIG